MGRDCGSVPVSPHRSAREALVVGSWRRKTETELQSLPRSLLDDAQNELDYPIDREPIRSYDADEGS
jgi:hypothetical protein